MSGSTIHYLLGGLIVLVGSIAFIKLLDFLSAQSVKRLLEMAKEGPRGSDNPPIHG